MKHNKKLNQGNTLVELVLYMVLLSIFMLVLFNLFAMIISIQTRSEAVSLVQSNGNYLLAKLSYDINQADSITYPAGVGESATSMTIVTSGVSYNYSVSNGQLVVDNGTIINSLNDSDTEISDLLIRRLGNVGGKNNLKISFRISSEVIDNTGVKSAEFMTTAGVR